VKLFGVRQSTSVEPETFIEPAGIDDERVALPAPIEWP
jgi:hypothetical protein